MFIPLFFHILGFGLHRCIPAMYSGVSGCTAVYICMVNVLTHFYYSWTMSNLFYFIIEFFSQFVKSRWSYLRTSRQRWESAWNFRKTIRPASRAGLKGGCQGSQACCWCNLLLRAAWYAMLRRIQCWWPHLSSDRGISFVWWREEQRNQHSKRCVRRIRKPGISISVVVLRHEGAVRLHPCRGEVGQK
jgi:hypothetical protein